MAHPQSSNTKRSDHHSPIDNDNDDNMDIDSNAQTIDDDGLPLPSPSSAIRALQAIHHPSSRHHHTSNNHDHHHHHRHLDGVDHGDTSEMDDDRSIDPMRHAAMNDRLMNAQLSAFDRLAMRSRLLVACGAASIFALFVVYALYLCNSDSWNNHWMDLLLYSLLLAPTSFIAYRRLSYYYKVVPPHLRSLHGGISDVELAELGGVAPSAPSAAASSSSRMSSRSVVAASSSSVSRTVNDNVGFDLGAGGEAIMFSARNNTSNSNNSNGSNHGGIDGDSAPYLQHALSQQRADEAKQIAELSAASPLPIDYNDDSDDDDHNNDMHDPRHSHRDDDIDRPGRCRIESAVLATASVIILLLTLLIVPSPNLVVSLLSIFFGLTIWCVLYFIIHGTIDKPHHDSVWLSILLATSMFVVFLSTKHYYPACPGHVRGYQGQLYESQISYMPWNCMHPRLSIRDTTNSSQQLIGGLPPVHFAINATTNAWTIYGRVPHIKWSNNTITPPLGPPPSLYIMNLSLECDGRIDAQQQNQYRRHDIIDATDGDDARWGTRDNDDGDMSRITLVQLIRPLYIQIHHDDDGGDEPLAGDRDIIRVTESNSVGSAWKFLPCATIPPSINYISIYDNYTNVAILCCSILVMLWPTLRCLSCARQYGFCLCSFCPWCRRSYHGLHHAPDSA